MAGCPIESNSRNADSWHIEKTVSYGHIITTLMVVISVLYYFTGMEKDFALTKQQVVSNSNEIIAIKLDSKEQLHRIEEKIDRMNTIMIRSLQQHDRPQQ